jgi:hypothetical protein
MFKLLVGLLGLLETLYPDRVVRVVTRLGYDYEGDPPVAKPWVVTVARIEGVLLLGAVVYAALRGDGSCRLCRGRDADDSDDTDDSDDSDDTGADSDDASIDRID